MRLRNVYQSLNRLVFERRLPEEPEINCICQNVTISGNDMVTGLKSFQLFHMNTPDLCMQMAEQYHKRHTLSQSDILYKFKDIVPNINYVKKICILYFKDIALSNKYMINVNAYM